MLLINANNGIINSIAAILDTLTDQHFVVRDRTEVPRRGAPVGKYFLNDAEFHFLGIDIGPEGAFGQWINASGNRLDATEWDRGILMTTTAALPFSALSMSRR